MKKQRYHFSVKFPARGGYLNSNSGFSMSEFVSRNKESHVFIHKTTFSSFIEQKSGHAWGSYLHYPPHGMSDKSAVELLIDRTRDYPFLHNQKFNQTSLQRYHDSIIQRLGNYADNLTPVNLICLSSAKSRFNFRNWMPNSKATNLLKQPGSKR